MAFCNYEWQNDIFVNTMARGDGTTRIRSPSMQAAASSSPPFSPTSIFVLQASMVVLLAIFHVFG